jgi:hypothetical protein
MPLETKSQRSRNPRHAFWKVGGVARLCCVIGKCRLFVDYARDVTFPKENCRSQNGPRRHCTQTAQIIQATRAPEPTRQPGATSSGVKVVQGHP